MILGRANSIKCWGWKAQYNKKIPAKTANTARSLGLVALCELAFLPFIACPPHSPLPHTYSPSLTGTFVGICSSSCFFFLSLARMITHSCSLLLAQLNCLTALWSPSRSHCHMGLHAEFLHLSVPWHDLVTCLLLFISLLGNSWWVVGAESSSWSASTSQSTMHVVIHKIGWNMTTGIYSSWSLQQIWDTASCWIDLVWLLDMLNLRWPRYMQVEEEICYWNSVCLRNPSLLWDPGDFSSSTFSSSQIETLVCPDRSNGWTVI